MTRRASLPKITGCEEPAPQGEVFTEPRMIRAIFVFAVVAALCIAHIHLQFVHTDMKLQHFELQKKLTVLRQEEDRLERENEALCGRQRLAVVAQRERMQSIDVRRQVVAVVPRSLREKYAAPVPGATLPQMDSLLAAAKPASGKLAEKLVALVDAAPAHAAGLLPEKN